MDRLILIQRIIAMLIIFILLTGLLIIYLYENREPEIIVEYRDNIKVEKEIVTEYVEISEIDWEPFTVTAYTSFDEGCNNYSAIGLNIAKWDNYFNFVAVDPGVIPYGKTVFIKTDNEIIEALAVDTGGAIQGKHIDLYINDLDLAYEWGVKTLPVGVVE